MKNFFSLSLKNIFLSPKIAFFFFFSVLIWGIALGCFNAVFTNFLVNECAINEYQRGVLEVFRELPGLLLVFILAIMARQTEWKILQIGILVSIFGITGLLFTQNKSLLAILILIWSTGEHILLPLRSSIAMHLAKPEKVGISLGWLASSMNAGIVSGSVLVAIIFTIMLNFYGITNQRIIYNIVWGVIVLLLFISICSILFIPKEDKYVNRPKFYLNKKFSYYYVLEIFYGARKQIFLTFAPFVMVYIYDFTTSQMAILLGICAFSNMFIAPLIGRLTDKIGYRNIMIYDTLILFFVCIIYGFSHKWFPFHFACIIVCINFWLDAIISNASLATNIYVKEIADSPTEITATLTTGISTNHLISILTAFFGGWVWSHLGVEFLFCFSAGMGLLNSLFAYLIPKPNTKNSISFKK